MVGYQQASSSTPGFANEHFSALGNGCTWVAGGMAGQVPLLFYLQFLICKKEIRTHPRTHQESRDSRWTRQIMSFFNGENNWTAKRRSSFTQPAGRRSLVLKSFEGATGVEQKKSQAVCNQDQPTLLLHPIYLLTSPSLFQDLHEYCSSQWKQTESQRLCRTVGQSPMKQK